MSTYYVSTTGNDASSGTKTRPLARVAAAVARAKPGDTIYLRGGRHRVEQQITIGLNGVGRSGAPGRPILLANYPGETPILDAASASKTGSFATIRLAADWWHLRGITVEHSLLGFLTNGAHNTHERCTARYGAHTGFTINGGNGRPTHDNLWLNCDAHDNYDPPDGGSADGFNQADLVSGSGNRYIGCRAWNNSDDGFDFINAQTPVELTRCWAWGNGLDWFTGTGRLFEGNGFKLGYMDSTIPHELRRCAAWRNGIHGFMYFGEAEQRLIHCTGFDNGYDPKNTGRNFQFVNTPVYVCNCASYKWPRVPDFLCPGTDLAHNSFGMSLTDHDFMSLDPTIAEGPRDADGNLPVSEFLMPSLTGKLFAAGAKLGEPYIPPAPDLGAFENTSPLIEQVLDRLKTQLTR